MSKAKVLSELEGCVLGMVRQMQPCTPYAVRRELKRSPSPHWGRSAGAIYPVFERLRAARLLRAQPHSTGERRGLHYSVTARGERALRDWIGPALDELTASLPMDPLRTRVTFFGHLTKRERRTFLDSAERLLNEQLQRAQAHEDEIDDEFDLLVSEGAIAAQQARLAWIRKIRRAIA